jgi:hypothetical protein
MHSSFSQGNGLVAGTPGHAVQSIRHSDNNKELSMERATPCNQVVADERIIISESDMVVMKLVYGTGQMQNYKDSRMKLPITKQTPVHHRAESQNSLHPMDSSLPVMGLSLTDNFERQSMLLSSANLHGFFQVAKTTAFSRVQ